jgi:phage gp29-like protein
MPRYRPSYERPYGRPLGSVVYWPVKFRHSGLRFFTQFVEKYGTPWLRAEYPLGAQASRVQEMLSMLDTTVQDGIVAHPSEFKVEALKMNDGSSADIHSKYIDMMNEEIAIGILGQTLTTKMSASGGSFAAAKVHATVRDDIVCEDKKLVEMVYNTMISWIYELNWANSDARPTFKMIAAPQPTKDDAQMAVYLGSTGIKFTKEYYQNRFNLLDTEFELAPVMAAGPGLPGESVAEKTVPPDTGSEIAQHEATDTATNSPTYDATKSAVKTLTGGR